MHRYFRLKKFTAAALLFLLLGTLTIPAFADTGIQIGNFTAEEDASLGASASSGNADGEQAQMITLSNGVSYATDRGLFSYSVEGSRFGISVPDGAIVTGAVWAELDPVLTAALYRDGYEIENPDLTCIENPGKYVLAVTANSATKTVRVSFTIVAALTNEVKDYILPTDFYMVSATLNGGAASYSQTYVDMSVDGDYVIDYRCPEANVDMRLEVTVDHTPPEVTLTGIVDGKANGPVTVSELEPGASAYLERNGKDAAYTGTISETGSYVLTIRDAAGNQQIYDFVVVTYANSSLKALGATIVVLILALIGYLIYYRKYIRVS